MNALDTPPHVVEALGDLLSWLKRAGIPHVVIGGLAVALVGKPRTTRDIDGVILMGDLSWEGVLEAAKNAGFEPRIPRAAGFARRTRVFLLRHAKTGVDVDLSAGALPFEEEAVSRARLQVIRGIEVPVATPEDLVVMKIVASRPRDIADIEDLLLTNPSLDLKRVRRYVRLFAEALQAPGLTKRLEELLKARRRGR